jgi:hypothetical protein
VHGRAKWRRRRERQQHELLDVGTYSNEGRGPACIELSATVMVCYRVVVEVTITVIVTVTWFRIDLNTLSGGNTAS